MKQFRRSGVRVMMVIICLLCFVGVSSAAEKITFGYVNWPGVTAKTYVATKILSSLGYEIDMKMLSVPIVFKGLANKDLDIFLGAWLPTMKSIPTLTSVTRFPCPRLGS